MTQPRIRLGDLSVGFLHPVTAALESMGLDARPLLQSFGLTPSRLATAGARLSIPRYMRLGHTAIELSGRPDLGLLAGRQARLEHLGLAGACAALAPDTGTAISALTRYELLYAYNYLGQSCIEEDSGQTWIRFYSIAPYNDYNRFVVDAVLKSWHSYLQQVAGQPVPLERVQIEYPAPPHAAAFADAFGCPVEFSASANRLLCATGSLRLANHRHCAHSWHELDQLCRQQLALRQAPDNLPDRVTRLLGPQLRQGEPELASIARQLQLPSWTLQRRLEQAGTSFRQLVQETRHGLAVCYLRDTDLALAEIAWQLGFASSEAFQRAFKRWQGQTPGLFRRMVNGEW